MPTLITAPQTVLVSDTPYQAAALIPDATALGDESDETYADQWFSYRPDGGGGPTLRAQFPALPGFTISQMRMRFEVFNDNGGTGTEVVVSVFGSVSGDLIATLRRPGAPTAIIDVPALNTIYDYDDWEFNQVSTDETLDEALRTGLLVQARRNPFVGSSGTPRDPEGGDYCLRVYELQFRLTGCFATFDIPATVISLGVIDSTHPTPNDGSVTQVNDGDAGYLEMDAVGATSSVGSNVGINFPATAVPGDVIAVSLVTVTKGTDSRVQPYITDPTLHGTGAGLLLTGPGPTNWYWYPGAGNHGGDNIFANETTEWTEGITPLVLDGVEVITKEMIESGTVQRFPGYAVLNDGVGAGFMDVGHPGLWNSKWTYVALRVTYSYPCGGSIPPRRGWPRHQATTAARGVGGRDDIQTGPRGIGAVV